METYEEYKDSGVDWLGQVPAGWELLANKHIFSLKKQLVGKKSSEYDLLSLTLGGIIRRDMENPEGKFPAEFDTYQEVNEGDFVFCHFDVEETPRTVGLSRFNGMITGAYTVYQVAPEVDDQFIYYFYLNADAGKKLRGLYKGLRNTISKETFAAFKTPLPSLSEQAAIAGFLDDKVGKVEELVAIKQAQIDLLKERKQILIQEAVTKGLTPDTPMKDSGIDWIGQIPAHWKVKRLKYICEIVKRIIGHEGPDVLSITQRGIKIKDVKSGEGQLAANYSTYQIVECGDFAMNHMDLITGYVDISKFDGVTSPDYRVFKNASPLLDDKFLLLLFQMGYKMRTFFKYGQGVHTQGRWRFPADSFNNFFIPIPNLSEQRSIIETVEAVSKKIEDATAIKENQITKLNEYKVTLINAAVTGKIKVPEQYFSKDV